MSASITRSAKLSATLTPQVAVAIAVDTAFIAGHADSGQISQGVFMMDNMVRNGSTGEGSLSLHTVCAVGNLIGFQVMPVNASGSSGDSVIITGFADMQGNVFTGAGHPRQQPPLGNLPAGSYWIGQAMAAGTETYSIQILVQVGALQPVSVYVWWEAMITAS